MADSDDDMPPLEYAGVGVPPAAATQATPPEDDDDDMPPLEYVGADASLGISLREGDSVILKGLSKTALNGQTGTLQSFQKASKGRLPVKLDKSGSMLAVKPENIEKINTKVGGIPNHGVASAKATHVDRNASPPPPDDDDDELPPLEYVGEITNGTAEHGTGQMSDADDMPSLEYFGTSKPSGPNHSKDSQPSVSKPSPPYAEARATGAPKEVPAATEKVLPETPVSTFRPGDQVLIKGTTKQLDGQQGIIESIKDGTCFVRLEKNKDVLQLGEANLHKIWLRGSGAGAMPPLQMVGQANGSAPLYSAPNGQNGTEVERIKAPAESKAPRSSQGNRQEAQDALQKMRSALHATASHEVDDALRLAETPGMAWGEWETEKTQILKQLRTKRSQIVEVRPQESQEVSRTVKKSTIETWCEELQLPQELLARLNEEDVTDPEELTGVGETELAALTSGLKIGPKGRFMKAVKRMKALEAAELGSAVSLS